MPLKVSLQGKRWHYSGTVAGRRLRRSCRTANKARAERIAAEAEARAWKGHLDGPASVLTFAQAAASYRAIGKPTRFLKKIENHWENTLVKDMTEGVIQKAAIQLYPLASAATRNRQVIAPTQAIINHAASIGWCPIVRVKRFPVAKKVRDYATWEWIQAFMAHATPHVGALACFMFLTGARISEALAVEWTDIDLGQMTVTIRQSKLHGEERSAHLPQPLVVAIANISRTKKTVFKFSSKDTAKPEWRRAIRKAGIKPLSYHACRHGFATGLLRSQVDPITVAKRGGWKSPAHVFGTYGHAMEDVTITDRLIGKNLASPPADDLITVSEQRLKK
jgi:integrase